LACSPNDDNAIDSEAAIVLLLNSSAKKMLNLRSLCLDGNPLGPTLGAALAAGLTGGSDGELPLLLTKLALRSTGLNDNCVEDLARSPLVANLTDLELDWNELSDRSAFALARSPQLTRLAYLGLRGPALSSAARDALQERFGEGACAFSPL
jgi:hypothetical protein